MIEEDKALQLFAICYQIAGTVCLADGEITDKDEELLLNTLAHPNGPGAMILLSNEGPYQEVMDAALLAEKEQRINAYIDCVEEIMK